MRSARPHYLEGSISPQLLEEIRSGRATHAQKLAICSGTASLEPRDRVELLAVLAVDADEVIAGRAAGALLSQPGDAILAALARANPAPQLFQYCAKHLANKPGVADAMAQNPKCPAALLVLAAPCLSTGAVQALMDDLDRLSSAPALAAALATSSSLTADQRHQLQELQQESSDEAAIAAEPDRAKRQTLLQRLARMRVVERVQLALKGNREERLTLIRDPCKVVQRAVLQSPRITDREAESFAAMANLSDEVLRLLASNHAFRKNYTVVRNLTFNPKTPLDVSLHLLPNITPQDLKMLATNKNIPDTLRAMALKLHRQRSKAREGS
jgi:hypothetical protein